MKFYSKCQSSIENGKTDESQSLHLCYTHKKCQANLHNLMIARRRERHTVPRYIGNLIINFNQND